MIEPKVEQVRYVEVRLSGQGDVSCGVRLVYKPHLTQEDYEDAAVEQARAGDVSWIYDGVDDESIETQDFWAEGNEIPKKDEVIEFLQEKLGALSIENNALLKGRMTKERVARKAGVVDQYELVMEILRKLRAQQK